MDSSDFHNVYHHLHERYTLHILYIGNSHLFFHICHLQVLVLWVAVLADNVARLDFVFVFGFGLSIVLIGGFGQRLGIVAFECS